MVILVGGGFDFGLGFLVKREDFCRHVGPTVAAMVVTLAGKRGILPYIERA